jgi:murein DD-endopeptidase MepM/ murein hydrolase activator NlpD
MKSQFLKKPLKILSVIVLFIGTFGILAQEQLAETAQILPTTTVQGQFSSLELYFAFIKQGRVGLIRVVGENATINGTFLDKPLTFFAIDGIDGKFALITAPISQAPRDYELSVTVNSTQAEETLIAPIAIESGGFLRQEVIVVGEANNLLNREIEDAELARIFELSQPITPIAYWQGSGFIPPIDTELTSPFGAVRVFNGLYETLHTGWDYNAPTGKPLKATAGGTVVFAGRMDIRGNYVLIDHGYGIYSGYAHLSVIYVTQGQTLTNGQFVGVVGTTGRSSSAHAHFEMLVNNQWIDSSDFLTKIGFSPLQAP